MDRKEVFVKASESFFFSDDLEGHELHVVPDGSVYRVALIYDTGAIDWTPGFVNFDEAKKWMWDDIRRIRR